MICERGHRVIDSTGLHYSLLERPEFGFGDRHEAQVARYFVYFHGTCDEVAAECQGSDLTPSVKSASPGSGA